MEKLTLQEIKKAVNGMTEYDCDVNNISIDTRNICEGDLYIAIKGENFDGHDFIEQAFSKGAVACISEKEVVGKKNIVVVENTSKALIDLARFYKNKFNIFTVGVTGSVGKTSTKEMIATILAIKGKTLKTKGNFNNEIGLPLTLFNLDHKTVNAVLEMGMSDFGEISTLTHICNPNVAVITNIGVAHLENLKTRENILKAKLEIAESMSADAPLILNADDDLLITAGAYVDQPIIYFGLSSATADITATDIKQDGVSTSFNINYYGKSIKAIIPTVGRHNVMNALAGFCVGISSNISPEQIVGAMKWYKNASMRQNTVEVKGITLIEDCYNASPASMEAAIDVITEISCCGKRVCVFGGMLELGELSDEAHIEIGKQVARSRVDYLLCYGEMGKLIKKGAIIVGMKNVLHFNDKESLAEYMIGKFKKDDAIIFKASRGVKLEEAINLYKTMLG